MKSEVWRPLRWQKKPVLTVNLLSSTKTLLQKNGMIFFFRTNVQNICVSCLIAKMMLLGGGGGDSGEPSASCIPGEKKLKMDHLGRNDRPQSHWASFIPQGQTLTADYYINNILEKEVKPLFRSKNVNEAIHKRKLFSSNRHMSSSKTGAAHAVKATQAWCKSNLPNFIEKTSCCGLQIRQISTLWRIFGA